MEKNRFSEPVFCQFLQQGRNALKRWNNGVLYTYTWVLFEDIPHARTTPGRSLLWGFAITKARRPGDNHGVSLSGTLYGKRAWPLTICNYSYFIKAHKMLVWPFGSPLQEKETDLNTPVCAPSSLDRGYPCLSLVGAAHSAKWEFSNPTGKVIYHNWLHNAPKLWYDYRWKGVLLLSSPWKAQCPNWSHAWITPYKRRTSAVRGFLSHEFIANKLTRGVTRAFFAQEKQWCFIYGIFVAIIKSEVEGLSGGDCFKRAKK